MSRFQISRIFISTLTWMAAILVAITPGVIGADSGGVLPWTQWVMSISAALAMVLALPVCLSRDRVVSIHSALIGLLLLIVVFYASLQSTRLPILAPFASGSANAYAEAEQIVGLTTSTSSESPNPSSIAPWLTRQNTSVLIVVAAFAFLASQLFVTRGRLTAILSMLALTGAVHAGFGMVQILTDPECTVWGIRSFMGGIPFGSYINRSNAAVMLNIGLACSLGLIAWRLAAVTGTSLADDAFPTSELLDVIFDRVAMIGILTALVSIAGLLASGSRGGLVGTIAGLMMAFGIVQTIHRGRGILPTLLGVGLMAAVLLVQIKLPANSLDRLQDTPDSVVTDDGIRDGRIDHWKDAWQAAWAQPVIGWGLGTYRYAYLPFQRHSLGSWFVNADNLWIEWFVEMGLIGVAILVVAIWFLVRALQTLNNSPDPIDHGLGTAGWFALGSLGVSQFFDFGLRIPANSIAAAILFGAVIGRSTVIGSVDLYRARSADTDRSNSTHQSRKSPFTSLIGASRGPLLNLSLFILFGLALVPAVRFLDGAARGDYWSRLAKRLPRNVQFNADQATALKDSLIQYTSMHPDDTQALLELSQLTFELARAEAATDTAAPPGSDQWLVNYRALSTDVLRSAWYQQIPQPDSNPPTKSAAPTLTATGSALPAPLFPYVDMLSSQTVHGVSNLARATPVTLTSAAESVAKEAEDSPANPDLEKQMLEFGTKVHMARQSAIEALRACPLSDEAYIAVASLDFAGGSPQQSEKLITKLIDLRRQNGRSQLLAGQIAAQSKHWDLAASAFGRAVSLEPPLTHAVRSSLPDGSPLSMAQLLPDNVDAITIAVTQELGKPRPDRALLIRAESLLSRSLPDDRVERGTRLLLLARIHLKREQPQLAAETLAKAVALVPGNTEIRYQYAVALRAAGNLNEARQQIRAGRQIAPQDTRFEQLMTAMTQSEE